MLVMLAKFLVSRKFNDPGRLNDGVFVMLNASARNSNLPLAPNAQLLREAQVQLPQGWAGDLAPLAAERAEVGLSDGRHRVRVRKGGRVVELCTSLRQRRDRRRPARNSRCPILRPDVQLMVCAWPL